MNRVLDTGIASPICLAILGTRLAIAFPRIGIKYYLLENGILSILELSYGVFISFTGSWLPRRRIRINDVSAVKFLNEGHAVVFGTVAGKMWVIVS